MSSIFSLLCFLFAFNAFADDVYIRGYLIAVDTRADSKCKFVQQKVAAGSTTNVGKLCEHDKEKPYSIIVMSRPLTEFENDINQVSSGSEDDKFYVIPQNKELEHFLHFTSKPAQTEISISRQSDFASMTQNSNSLMVIPFVLKLDSKFTEKGSYIRGQSERLQEMDKRKYLSFLDTQILNRKIRFEFWSPDADQCYPGSICPYSNISVGLKINVRH
ncbi:MAG: hypothetical protein ACXVCP_11875 [Bdellovibrio sp.]